MSNKADIRRKVSPDARTVKALLSAQEAKLSTDLLELTRPDLFPKITDTVRVRARMQRLKQLIPADTFFSTKGTSDIAGSDLVFVYILLTPTGAISSVSPYVRDVVNADDALRLIAAYVEVSKLQDITALPDVRAVRPVVPPQTRRGDHTTAGDPIHRSDMVRLLHNGTGSGLKIGVISDGVNHRSTAQASGDLPQDGPDLHIVRDRLEGDEGTAILEIIHDMAPDAALAFHDCGNNVLDFNRAVTALADDGCNIIMDDIGWLIEPFFELGTVGGHVSALLEQRDIIYISSAGNSASEHHQKAFTSDQYGWHIAGNDDTGPDLYIRLPRNASVLVVLQWNEPFGASGHDYDLYLTELDTDKILAQSINYQNGDDDPIEYLQYTNYGAAIDASVAVFDETGKGDHIVEIFLYPDDGAFVYPDNITEADSIFGHPVVPDVVTVGAVDALYPDDIEYFSARGPVTLLNDVVPKPDICGVDGVEVSGAGDFPSPFYGTSAAAPHVAAVAAQLWGKDPTLRRDEVVSYLLGNATDLGDNGFDTIFGFGRADALAAFNAIPVLCKTDEDCNDANVCTDDACNPETGACEYANNNAPCDDKDACTENDICARGQCNGQSIRCDDKNDCTDDTCDKILGCKYRANQNPCDDGNLCTDNDRCSNSECSGVEVSCDDNNDCTDDTCDPAKGCRRDFNTKTCDDGNSCTTNDRCTNGTCKGNVLSCDDGNVCTDDRCDTDRGCRHLANTAPCDDDIYCNGADSCVEGKCVHKGDPCLDDGTFCNGMESCDEQTDRCVSSGDPCSSDGFFCNGDEQCNETKNGCEHMGNPCSDDGLFCNGSEICDDSIDKCGHTGNPCQGAYICNETRDACNMGCGGCEIDKICFEAGDTNPINSCERCEAAISNTTWTKQTGSICSDKNECTDNDLCDNGTCVGEKLPNWTSCGSELQDACFNGKCEVEPEGDRSSEPIVLKLREIKFGDFDGYHAYLSVPAACGGEALYGIDTFYKVTLTYDETYELIVTPGAEAKIAVSIWTEHNNELQCLSTIRNADLAGGEIKYSFTHNGDPIIWIQLIFLPENTDESATDYKILLHPTPSEIDTEETRDSETGVNTETEQPIDSASEEIADSMPDTGLDSETDSRFIQDAGNDSESETETETASETSEIDTAQQPTPNDTNDTDTETVDAGEGDKPQKGGCGCTFVGRAQNPDFKFWRLLTL